MDDELLEQAHRLSGVQSRPSLIHEVLKALVQREKAFSRKYSSLFDQVRCGDSMDRIMKTLLRSGW
jgi:hypothetical protein